MTAISTIQCDECGCGKSTFDSLKTPLDVRRHLYQEKKWVFMRGFDLCEKCKDKKNLSCETQRKMFEKINNESKK